MKKSIVIIVIVLAIAIIGGGALYYFEETKIENVFETYKESYNEGLKEFGVLDPDCEEFVWHIAMNDHDDIWKFISTRYTFKGEGYDYFTTVMLYDDHAKTFDLDNVVFDCGFEECSYAEFVELRDM